MPEDWNELVVRAPHWSRLSSRMIKVPVPSYVQNAFILPFEFLTQIHPCANRKSDVTKTVNTVNKAVNKANAAQSSASPSQTPAAISQQVSGNKNMDASRIGCVIFNFLILFYHTQITCLRQPDGRRPTEDGRNRLQDKDRRPGDDRNRDHRLEEDRNRKDRRPGDDRNRLNDRPNERRPEDRNRFNDRLPNERRPEDRNRFNDRLPNERRPEDRNRLNDKLPVERRPGSPEIPKGPVVPNLPIERRPVAPGSPELPKGPVDPKLPINNKVPIHKTQTNPAAPAKVSSTAKAAPTPNKLQEEQSLINQLYKLEGRDETYPRSLDDEIYELLMRRFVPFISVVVSTV
jgi:hypothetical protein